MFSGLLSAARAVSEQLPPEMKIVADVGVALGTKYIEMDVQQRKTFVAIVMEISGATRQSGLLANPVGVRFIAKVSELVWDAGGFKGLELLSKFLAHFGEREARVAKEVVLDVVRLISVSPGFMEGALSMLHARTWDLPTLLQVALEAAGISPVRQRAVHQIYYLYKYYGAKKRQYEQSPEAQAIDGVFPYKGSAVNEPAHLASSLGKSSTWATATLQMLQKEPYHFLPGGKVSDAEALAVFLYSTDEVYGELNDDMRRKTRGELDHKWSQLIGTLRQATTHLPCPVTPPNPVTLYRGQSGLYGVQKRPGYTFAWTAFNSFSTELPTAVEFASRSNGPGTGVIFELSGPLDHFECGQVWDLSEYPDEREVLVNNHRAFTVVRDEPKRAHECGVSDYLVLSWGGK